MKKKLQILVLCLSVVVFINATFSQVDQKTENNQKIAQADTTIKIDSTTGLIVAEGLDLVSVHCTGCHSGKLITQFHADKNGWLEKIRWMQQKQKLWDLGTAEPIILAYLSKNYPPLENKNRRGNLKINNWYNL
jgi:hypothetical protein